MTRTMQLLICAMYVVVTAQIILHPLSPSDDSESEAYRIALKGAVRIESPRFGSGSGFIIDKQNGLIVTNAHVIGPNIALFVTYPIYIDKKPVTEPSYYLKNTKPTPALLIDIDMHRDLALIQVKEPIPDESNELLISSEGTDPGNHVVAVGNPGASKSFWVFTSGQVRNRYFREDRLPKYRILETSQALNHGDSGGPTVNLKGDVVGISTSGISDANLNSYLPNRKCPEFTRHDSVESGFNQTVLILV